jgi:hypothetical protein
VPTELNPACLRFEMALREGTAGARPQIALEADGPVLVSELDGNVKEPRPTSRRVWTMARAVIPSLAFTSHVRPT